jgi:hypothetical protein
MRNNKRNPVAISMALRYGKTTRVIKDRRTPRGGARNKQRDILRDAD